VHEGVCADGRLPETQESFWAELVAARVDVAALQEVRLRADGDLDDLTLAAKSAGMPHVSVFSLSASSVREGELAGLALLSREPFRDEQREKLPNLGLSGEADGSSIESYDKGLLSAVLDHNGLPLRVVSLHVPPFHRFGRAADEFPFLWEAVAKSIGPLDGTPLLVCGDFNTDDRELLTDQIDGELRSAIAGQETHRGRSFDDILHSDALDLVHREVIPTQSDHAICVAEFDFPRPVDHTATEAATSGGHDAREHLRGQPLA
jgi:endonuclease/exonuclease/phosphatase family metal-dependent hydrolase